MGETLARAKSLFPVSESTGDGRAPAPVHYLCAICDGEILNMDEMVMQITPLEAGPVLAINERAHIECAEAMEE